MIKDRILIQFTPEQKAYLDKKREQGFTVTGYVRMLVEADRKKGKK